MYSNRKIRKGNENAGQTPPKDQKEEPTNEYKNNEQVIYADIVRNTDKDDESSFSSNQPQPDVIYSEFAVTQPDSIYANETELHWK